MKLTRLVLSTVFFSLLFISCGTSNNAMNPKVPHTYLNSYNQVLDAVNKSFAQTGMKVFETNEVQKTYYIKFFSKKIYDLNGGAPNPDSALMAEMIVEKVDDNRTKVTIKEEEQSSMMPGEYKQNLGRKMLRELNKQLTHETQSTDNAPEG